MQPILFIADQWETLDYSRDSTLHLAKSALEDFQSPCFWTLEKNIFLEKNSLFVKTCGELQVTSNLAQMLKEKQEVMPLDFFHSIHWRVDPPVTLQTFRLWQLLTVFEQKLKFFNSPRGMLNLNEKFSNFYFSNWFIESFISNEEETWKNFYKNINQSNPRATIIVKPASNAASRGVQILPTNWEAAQPILIKMQQEHGPWLVIQEFDEKILNLGETRVFILNGEVIGALNKKPKPLRPINNLDAPPNERPTMTICGLSTEQESRSQTIAQKLKQEGIYLATIDFIGSCLLEINVTSPGLLKWFDENHLYTNTTTFAQKYWKNIL